MLQAAWQGGWVEGQEGVTVVPTFHRQVPSLAGGTSQKDGCVQ